MKPRRISLKENEREIGKIRGPNGNRLCRWCRNEVSPPKRTFCGSLCSHEWRIRSNTKYLRQKVYERDRGVCAVCKMDTRLQKIKIENEQTNAMSRCKVFDHAPLFNWRSDTEYNEFLKQERITPYEAEKSLWHADHIKEVADGGGLSGFNGFATLCIRCHKSKSKTSMKERRLLKNNRSVI